MEKLLFDPTSRIHSRPSNQLHEPRSCWKDLYYALIEVKKIPLFSPVSSSCVNEEFKEAVQSFRVPS